jgi:phosphoribosyl-ATP pyrophosphohydrolase/phosphoribosyl-AMP cyclohydrolase
VSGIVPAWPESGLLPVVTIDAATGKLLMQAWANREALAASAATGRAHYWSRSRGELWRKGDTSGHVQVIRDIRSDCDGDTILYVVEQTGPACHTGRPSCFFRRLDGEIWRDEDDNPWPQPDILRALAAVIESRTAADAGQSYVRSLLDDPGKAADKVREEADELCVAAADETADRVAAEAADLVFHALVLARTRGVDWNRIAGVLEARFGIGGHVEKAARHATDGTTDLAHGATEPRRGGTDQG